MALCWGVLVVKRRIGAAVTVLVLAGTIGSVSRGQSAADPDLGAVLRELLLDQTRAKQAEDLDAAFKNVDLPPRQREQMMDLFRQVFGRYDLVHTLDEFHLLGSDGEVAVARIRQTLRGVRAADFKDNQCDALQVFRKVDGSWKLHEQVILNTILLNPAPSTQPAPPASTQPAAPG